jgi:hypothetical protein
MQAAVLVVLELCLLLAQVGQAAVLLLLQYFQHLLLPVVLEALAAHSEPTVQEEGLAQQLQVLPVLLVAQPVAQEIILWAILL